MENIFAFAARILSEMGQGSSNILEALGKIEEYFQEVLNGNLRDLLIQNLCYSLLYDGFILLKCCYANLKKTIQEVMNEDLPERLKPKFREIRRYVESMEEKLQGLEAIVTEITTTASTLYLRTFALNIYCVLTELLQLIFTALS